MAKPNAFIQSLAAKGAKDPKALAGYIAKKKKRPKAMTDVEANATLPGIPKSGGG